MLTVNVKSNNIIIINNKNMNKFFTLLTAFALSLTVANAQIGGGAIMKLNEQPLEKFSTTQVNTPKVHKAKATPKKIEMAEGEHLVGFYTTDDLPDLSYGGYGITSQTGQLQAGAVFEDDVLNKYVGGQITKVRFAIATEVPIAGVYIYESTPDYDISTTPISSVDLSSYTPVEGWNDVTLTTPVTIESGKYYLIAYEYTQSSNTTSIEAYPLVTDEDLDVDVIPTYGFLVYAYWPSYRVTDWATMDDCGSLCIQAVVKGGNLIDEDITLSNLTADNYVSAGNELSYSYKIGNAGNVLPTSYSLNVAIDGNVVETLDTPVALMNKKQVVNGTLTVPSDLAQGDHTLSLQVATINGNTPTQYIDDDIVNASFVVYEGKAYRQMYLVEEYTSVQCRFCPLGHAVLDLLQEIRPNRYALVAIHSAGMGTDPFYLSDGSTEYLESFVMASGSSYPSASFNRYLYDDADLNPYGDIALSIGYDALYQELAASMIDDIVHSTYSKIPAFANIGIETDYNESTRQLTIKVYGDGVGIAKDILDGNRLTVYLTEDGLVSTQLLDNGSYQEDYVHNNVLRALVTTQGYPYCGDEINWTSESAYENDYTVTLDSSWNPENMHVVASISKSFLTPKSDGWYWADYSEAYVNNANMIKVGNSTGISKPISDANATETSRYTMDGRQLSSPVKGLNIVKMSDGTTRKVIVR